MGAAAKMLAQDAERVQVQVQVTTGGTKKRGQRGGRKEYKAQKAGQRKRNDKYGGKAA